jgi:hypothetical protein
VSEIDIYLGLTEHVRNNEPNYFERFRRTAVLTIVRSSARMDAEHFIKFAKHAKTGALVDGELARGMSAELATFKIFPRLYRALARTYMKLIFYRDGRTF